MWRTLIAVTCLSLVVGIDRGVAFATWLEVQLTGPAIVIVWKTPDAMKTGQELIRSGARVAAGELAVQVAEFASCAVATGTRAEVTRVAASWLWYAKVLDGADAGCVGIVAPRDFKTRDELSDSPGRPQAPHRPREASLEEARRLNEEGLRLFGEGRYGAAIPLVERAVAILETTLGPEHAYLAPVVGNLGRLYHTLGQHAQAEPLYRRSLAIQEKASGPTHPDVATTINNLTRLRLRPTRHADGERRRPRVDHRLGAQGSHGIRWPATSG